MVSILYNTQSKNIDTSFKYSVLGFEGLRIFSQVSEIHITVFVTTRYEITKNNWDTDLSHGYFE